MVELFEIVLLSDTSYVLWTTEAFTEHLLVINVFGGRLRYVPDKRLHIWMGLKDAES